MTNRKLIKIIDDAEITLDKYDLILNSYELEIFLKGYLNCLKIQLGEKEFNSIKQNLVDILECRYATEFNI